MFMHSNVWLINVTIDHGHHKKISLNKFYFFTFLVRDMVKPWSDHGQSAVFDHSIILSTFFQPYFPFFPLKNIDKMVEGSDTAD